MYSNKYTLNLLKIRKLKKTTQPRGGGPVTSFSKE